MSRFTSSRDMPRLCSFAAWIISFSGKRILRLTGVNFLLHFLHRYICFFPESLWRMPRFTILVLLQKIHFFLFFICQIIGIRTKIECWGGGLLWRQNEKTTKVVTLFVSKLPNEKSINAAGVILFFIRGRTEVRIRLCEGADSNRRTD